METTTENKLVLQQNGIAATINMKLLVFKYYYFLFYCAVGTTFPFLTRYFGQIGLSSGQVLVLAGVRPAVQLVLGPLWGILGDRYVSKKMLVQFSLLIWLIMTISTAFLEPTDQECQLVLVNQTQASVINSTTMKTGFFRKRRSAVEILETSLPTLLQNNSTVVNGEGSLVSGAGPIGDQDGGDLFSGSGLYVGLSKTDQIPAKQDTRGHTQQTKLEKESLKIEKRNVLRQSPEILNQIFLAALVIMTVIEVFSCPLLILIDAVLLSKQNEENFSYGQQRVFGSLGYFTSYFIVSALLQNSIHQACQDFYADFVICFCFLALITIVTLMGTVKLPAMNVVSVRAGTRPFSRLISIFYTRHYVTLLAYIIFMGFAHSFLENYHNSLVMNSQVPYGSSVTINFFRFTGEPVALFLSSMILNRTGIINILFGIPVVTAFNLFSSSFISSPWHVIPLGFLDGLTYGISWVACATYLVGSAPDDCIATVQGCFQSAYWGLGNGFRLFIGSSLVVLIGPSASLRLFTLVSLSTSIIFTLGLRDLHFTESNFYTVIASKLDMLCEGRVKCEVVPPTKLCEYRTELVTTPQDDSKKTERH